MMLFAKKILLNSGPYKKDEIIVERTTAGTFDIELIGDGKYEVYVIGSGAGATFNGGGYMSGYNIGSGGGSGSGFIGIVKLTAGTYSCKVGAGVGARESATPSYAGQDSYIGNAVIARGAPSHAYNSAGNGGSAPTVNVPIISTTLNRAGNPGTVTSNYGGAGGASVYNGYGAGGGGTGSSTAGYIKIVYKG